MKKPQTFRLKATIEAIQFSSDSSRNNSNNIAECVRFCGGNYEHIKRENAGHGPVGDVIHVQTVRGSWKAVPGDWIIRIANNKFMVIRPDEFDSRYEPA